MLRFIRVVLAICLLCRSISVASCMKLEQDIKNLVGTFLKRVEFRHVSAELEKKAIENIKRVNVLERQINQEVLAKEILKLSNEYSSRVEEIFRVSYLQSDFKDFQGFFIDQLKKIAENPEGNQILQTAIILFNLIDKINTAFRSETTAVIPIKLVVSFGDGASLFSGKGSNLSDLELAINLNLIGDNTFFHKKLGLCTFVPCLSSVERHSTIKKNIVHIRSCADPFWLLIAHESIHMTHCMLDRINNFFYEHIFGTLTEEDISVKVLELSEKLRQLQELLKSIPQLRCDTVVEAILEAKNNDKNSMISLYKFFKDSKRYYVRYRENLTMSARQFMQALPEMAELFPEIKRSVRPNMLDLCDKLEERETVIGSVISELTLRLAGKLPIRYIYQDAHSSLYEYLDVVCKVIGQTAFGKNFKTSDELSGYVGSYINDASNDLYFNSRFFIQPINYRLLSDPMFKDFDLTYDVPSKKLLEVSVVEQSQIVKPLKILPRLKKLIESTVRFFEQKNVSETINCLTKDKRIIKKEFVGILRGRFDEAEQIVSEVEEYLKTVTEEQYDLLKIEPLINLLKTIV